MKRSIAIVTDALWRKSVAAIRALGASGYTVFALGDGRLTTGFYSRYTGRRFSGPVAAEDPDGFGETLARAIAETGGEPAAVLPMEDATCEWLLSHGDELAENVEWLLPPAESFALARDKASTFSLAQELGIPVPRTYTPASAGELGDLVASNPVEEFVVKPRTSSGSAGIVYGSDIRAISLEQHWELHGPLLLQERIPRDGVAYGVSLLFDRAGQERAAFAHRRLREYPVSGGPSTQRVSAELGELHSYSRRLLSSLDWAGVAMVEWKIHPQGNRPMLLEINPRFWGSLALAVHAGVDFPTLYADAALGRPLPSALPSYPAGIVSRWMLPGDILRYATSPADQREPLGDFLRGSLRNAEEFDARDIRGTIASGLCQALLAANPKYWRYLRRT
ncbi:MAG TPA: ATP-grasp domain-containing protein [Solirubrobacteraceae bacterium]|nr:ATP-grasp domain-containing protein [Solirubrobacteraceae bacterium]